MSILRRVAWTVLVVWFVITATFAMLALIPGDPMRVLLGPNRSEQVVEAARERYCLDDGVIVQYGCFVSRAVRGDLGESYQSDQPVTTILANHAWPTLQLALAAIALQLAIGVPLGILAAKRRGRWADRAIGIGGLIALSAPSFVVAALLLDGVAFGLGWLPFGGYGGMSHLVLPAVTLAAAGSAYYARIVRAEMVDVLSSDFVRTARAKGLSERAVVGKHALRAALGPLVALVGVDLGALLGGAIAVEWLFEWPGLGRETMLAVQSRDTPVIVGVVLVSAVAIALANLLADVVQVWLDPRLR